MKNILKLSVSLFFNQILGFVAGGMCVIFVLLVAGSGIEGQLLFLAITFSFFAYTEYRAAFKYGFHDADRRNNPKSKAYLYKGAIAGMISALPLIILICFYFVCIAKDLTNTSAFAILYTRIASMYYCWPMCNIFPNHIPEVFLTSLLPVTIIPGLGYIAGYKNFMLYDIVCRILRIKPRV